MSCEIGNRRRASRFSGKSGKLCSRLFITQIKAVSLQARSLAAAGTAFSVRRRQFAPAVTDSPIFLFTYMDVYVHIRILGVRLPALRNYGHLRLTGPTGNRRSNPELAGRPGGGVSGIQQDI
jgi:hypothetical protein